MVVTNHLLTGMILQVISWAKVGDIEGGVPLDSHDELQRGYRIKPTVVPDTPIFFTIVSGGLSEWGLPLDLQEVSAPIFGKGYLKKVTLRTATTNKIVDANGLFQRTGTYQREGILGLSFGRIWSPYPFGSSSLNMKPLELTIWKRRKV